MQTKRFLLILFATFSFAMMALTGCWQNRPPFEEMTTTYVQRLSNVLDAPTPVQPSLKQLILPEKRRFLTNFPPINLGLLESYQLRDCGLFHLIAGRNSVLGKVQDQFHRMDYELRFLSQLKMCLTDTEIPEDIREKLKKIQQQKHSRLPYYWLSLLYASQPMRSQLSRSQWYQPGLTTAEIKPAFEVLNHVHHFIRTGDEPQAQMSLISIQEVIEKQQVLGILEYTMNNAAVLINYTTDYLTQYSGAIICGKNRDNTQAKYLRNVFQTFYIGQIQPYLAKTDATYQGIRQQLSFFSPVVSDQPYHYPIEETHQKFRESILKHTRFWQSFFHRCHLPVRH